VCSSDLVHEGTADTLSAMNSLSTGILANLNTLNTNVLQGFNATQNVTRDDGDKTRTAIASLAASIPNSRELDLQRQLTVALEDNRHNQLRSHVDSGNVTVTQNVNQNQLQTQTQQQLTNLVSVVNGLIGHQQAMATAINVGGVQRSNLTPTNISQ